MMAGPVAAASLPPPPPRRAARQAPRPRRWPAPSLRLRPVLVPTALVLFRAADATGSTAGHGGPAAGALVIGREDLLRVRASLGRISDELHLILGVLDQHLEASANVQTGEFVPLPREGLNGTGGAAGVARDGLDSRPLVSASVAWVWAFGEWLVWVGIFALDIGIVVGMQLFLESIGRKRGGSSIMPKKSVASAIAVKNAAGTAVPGAPIPTPSGTPGRESSQRLSVLSQEELLAAVLAEHWGKLAAAVGLAVASRLPQHILNNESVLCHMLINLAVMLRCMSLVMLLIRDDVALPKRDKAAAHQLGSSGAR